MRKVSPQLGRKWSEARKQRQRDNIARLKAEGRRVGPLPDPRTRYEERVCQFPPCGKTFTFRIRPKTEAERGRYCNQKCAIRHVSWQRRKVPADFDLLHDLYVVKNMTTVEIGAMFNVEHHAVSHRLIDVGIKPRKVGISRYVTCIEEGCDKDIYRIQHKTNGSWYGRRCYDHWRQHRKRVCHVYQKNNRPKINAYQQASRARQKQEVVIPEWVTRAIGL